MSLSRVAWITWAGTGITLLVAVLAGWNGISLWATTTVGFLSVPSAVGVPMGPPALHLTPFGGLGAAFLWTENLAAVVLVSTVFYRLHRRARSAVRSIPTTWWAFAIGSAAAGVVRGLATANAAYGSPSAHLTYALWGALFGFLWGLALGWLPALPAALVGRFAPVRAA